MRLASLLAVLALMALQNALPAFQATIEGVVRDGSTNQPMSGVTVYIADASQLRPVSTTPFVTTDAQGTFSLPVNSPGRYRLLPQTSGFVYARPARVQSFQTGVIVSVAKESVQKIELEMVREGIITGQILDPSGRPLSGVAVELFARVYSTTGKLVPFPLLGTLGLFRPSVTDDRGEYRYFGLPPGDYLIGAPRAVTTFFRRYYPGVEDLSRAALVRIDSGEEERLAPMTVMDSSETTSVHFRYKNPGGKFTNKGFNIGGDIFGVYSFGSGHQLESEIVLSMARGHYELTLSVGSGDGELQYAPVTLDVGNEELFLDPEFKEGLRVTGTLKLEDASGKSLDAEDIQCFLNPETGSVAAHTKAGCIGGQFSPGFYRLSMHRMPPDAYIVSARSGDLNVLADGIRIDRHTQLDILLSTPGSVIDGIVTDDRGEPLSAAVIALVPDAPLRNALPLYRSDIASYDGSFELRGIAPGSYRLIAWNDLPGAAYLNTAFMKTYEDKGIPIRIDAARHLTMDVKVVD